MQGQRRPEPARYADEYREAVEKVIQAKLRHPQKSSGKKPVAPKSSKIIDLVAVLQQSLATKPKKSVPSRSTRKRKAA